MDNVSTPSCLLPFQNIVFFQMRPLSFVDIAGDTIEFLPAENDQFLCRVNGEDKVKDALVTFNGNTISISKFNSTFKKEDSRRIFAWFGHVPVSCNQNVFLLIDFSWKDQNSGSQTSMCVFFMTAEITKDMFTFAKKYASRLRTLVTK